MPVCLPPCRLHRENIAIPGNFKIQPEFIWLAGKYKQMSVFDRVEFGRYSLTEWTLMMMVMQSCGLSVLCDWTTASATYIYSIHIYIFLLFSVLSKKGEMVLFSETRRMSIHDLTS